MELASACSTIRRTTNTNALVPVCSPCGPDATWIKKRLIQVLKDEMQAWWSPLVSRTALPTPPADALIQVSKVSHWVTDDWIKERLVPQI